MTHPISDARHLKRKFLTINIDILATLPSAQFVVMTRLLNAVDKRGRTKVSGAGLHHFIDGHPITPTEGKAAFAALQHRGLIRLIRQNKGHSRYQLADRIFGGFVNGEG
jgi:hypothetical protein